MIARRPSARPWSTRWRAAFDAVLGVDHAPLPLQRVSVRPAVACRSPIVDIGHGKAAARPELNVQAERRGCGAGGAAVAQDNDGRHFRGGRIESRVGRRVVVGVGFFAVASRKRDALRPRDQAFADLHIRALSDHLHDPVVGVYAHDGGRFGRACGGNEHVVSHCGNAAHRCERQFVFAGSPVPVDDHEASAVLTANNQGDAAVRQKGIRGLPERPLRFAGLCVAGKDRLSRPFLKRVQVPPPCPVRHEVQRSVWRPLRLEDAFSTSASHLNSPARRAVEAERGDP